MRAATIGLVLGAVACGPPKEIVKEDFAVTAAEVTCKRTKECDRGYYDLYFFGFDDCVQSFERSFKWLLESAEEADCDYDATDAADAYVEVMEMTCERFYEGEAQEVVAELFGDCFNFTTTDTYTYY